MSDLSTQQFMSLVEAAVLAPSADNRHLFRLQRSETGIRMWAHPEYAALPRHVQILSLISFGAAAENIRLRAHRMGFTADVQWAPDRAKPQLLAEIRTTRAQQTTLDALEGAIPDRHTNRRVIFRGPRLANADQTRWMSEATSAGTVQLAWFDSADARREVLRLIRVAETERFRSRTLHAELFSAVRFDVGWKSSATEGLAPGSLEVEPPMRPIFKAFRRWAVLRPFKVIGVHHIFAARAAYLPCRFAPHIGALTTSLQGDAGALAVGQTFQRIWLRATVEGFAFQPLAGAALLALPRTPGVSDGVRRTLTAGWGRLTPGRIPLMVFRLGRARPASVRSGRGPLEDYLWSRPARS